MLYCLSLHRPCRGRRERQNGSGGRGGGGSAVGGNGEKKAHYLEGFKRGRRAWDGHGEMGREQPTLNGRRGVVI